MVVVCLAASNDMDTGSADQKKYLELMQKSLIGATDAEDGVSEAEDGANSTIDLISSGEVHNTAHKSRAHKTIGRGATQTTTSWNEN